MPKATAVFDGDDSRLTGALASINGKMLALQSRIAKFAAAFIADHHAPVRPASRLDRAEFHGHFAMRRGARLHLLRDELDHEAESGKGRPIRV